MQEKKKTKTTQTKANQTTKKQILHTTVSGLLY